MSSSKSNSSALINALLVIGLLSGNSLSAQTFTVDDAELVSATGTTNVLSLELDAGPLGSDTDMTMLSGPQDATVNIAWNGAGYDVTGFSINSSTFNATDVNFSLIFGVSAQSSDLGGEVETLSPPSMVVDGVLDAADQLVTVNRGAIEAAGNTFDFASMPIVTSGQGDGTIELIPETISPAMEIYRINVTLPITFSQDFVIPGVPILGDVDANLSGSGTIVSSGTITVSLQAGDFDRDGDLTCRDIDILGEALQTSNEDVRFDLNADGHLSVEDYHFWVTEIKGTVIGDANFDGSADISDFNVWNQGKFLSDKGWCEGDFSGDGSTDTSDFNIWNQNKFTDNSSLSTVPEPQSFTALLSAIAILSASVRRRILAS